MKFSRKVIFTIVMVAVLSGCRAWDASMLVPANQPISPRLPTLERKIGDLVNANLFTNSDEIAVFTKEVENNLIDPYGNKYGYIVLKKTLFMPGLG